MSPSAAPDPVALRARLADARLLLVFTPELCGARDPLAVLRGLLPEVDLVQVRPKAPAGAAGAVGTAIAADPPAEARASFEWTRRVLASLAELRLPHPPPVMVNDRVDVALALWDEGCAGVHVGRDDLPLEAARALLGPAPLLGLSTHDLVEVAAARERALDLVGFGPAFPSATKGYGEGLGPERCWVAHEASLAPLFPIGGITLENAGELEPVGRAAVSSALLGARDPAAAARALRAALAGG